MSELTYDAMERIDDWLRLDSPSSDEVTYIPVRDGRAVIDEDGTRQLPHGLRDVTRSATLEV